ncbi:hypothetical protein RND81_04G011800 [Saponaria officinalis]|uniref:Uncharacterized protein n=1 Tax=Saponaria officinalis TaxID=3572 RepID=A0AAW1LGM7_SAPOF
MILCLGMVHMFQTRSDHSTFPPFISDPFIAFCNRIFTTNLCRPYSLQVSFSVLFFYLTYFSPIPTSGGRRSIVQPYLVFDVGVIYPFDPQVIWLGHDPPD